MRTNNWLLLCIYMFVYLFNKPFTILDTTSDVVLPPPPTHPHLHPSNVQIVAGVLQFTSVLTFWPCLPRDSIKPRRATLLLMFTGLPGLWRVGPVFCSGCLLSTVFLSPLCPSWNFSEGFLTLQPWEAFPWAPHCSPSILLLFPTQHFWTNFYILLVYAML